MAYGKRKKGGQRLMEMSRAGAKRKAARKAKTLAQAKANIAKGPVTRGGAKKKVAAKSTAAGRNRTALRTPRGAGSVAKKKKVAAPKSDAGKYMGPYSKRTTSAKRKSSGPAPLPKTMVGRQSFGETLKEKGPGAALDAGLISSLLLTRGRGPAGAKGKGALSRTMTRLKDTFKPKSSTPGRKKATPAEKAKSKRTEQGYADFRNQAREASRKNARRRGG